jgi:hypothetical protein
LEPEINITQIDFSKQFQTEKNSMAKDSSSGYPKQDDMMQTNKQLNFNFESSCHQDDAPECQSDTFSL